MRNKVRIIGGAWRSRQIAFPPRKDLRPTPDRVRETLFNWLGQELTGKACLDLFAGSGALGFEAASRGARRVVMVESDPVVLRALAANRDQLNAGAVEVAGTDAIAYLRADSEVYDVVFVDPPFKSAYWPRVASLLPPRLAPGAMVYHEGNLRSEPMPGWEVLKESRAGQVWYRLLMHSAGSS